MPRKRITTRTAERLSRLAYDLQELGLHMRAEGHDGEGNALCDMASRMGRLARGLADKVGGTP